MYRRCTGDGGDVRRYSDLADKTQSSAVDERRTAATLHPVSVYLSY